MEEIMNAGNDSRVFYRLIGEQRKGSNTLLQTLVVNGTELESPDEIRKGWAEHFQELATPLSNPKFDEQYKQMVDADVQKKEEESSPIDPVSVKEVKTALKRLNNNKAEDIMGLTAEHCKLAGHELSDFLTCFLNYVIDTGTVSMVLKEGILTPIFKKGDPSNPGNYRGITVTPVLLKILEHIINARHS